MSHAPCDHNCDDDGEGADDVPLVPFESVVDLEDVLACEIPQTAPGAHPQHRAEGAALVALSELRE